MVIASRKDIWMGIVVWAFILLFTWNIFQSIYVEVDIVAIIVMAALILLLGSIWFNTRYRIDDNNTLRISYGPMKWSININEIKSIRKTTNLFVGPCLSVHRLEIHYGNYKVIQISPKRMQLFIKEIQKINPGIQMNT
ncbi:PH domain-containing protein [Oceanobacillus iheyensis]|uniref:PH domain-containing protein n=1 Tax=Oceanobacillus iheyensis TaxID=182710 RepID=UPI00362BA2DC